MTDQTKILDETRTIINRLTFWRYTSWGPSAGYGELSRTWSYQLAGYPVAVSVDYPFKGWQ